MTKNLFLTAILFILPILSHEAEASSYAWSCIGKIQENQRDAQYLISGAREPGHNNVLIRAKDGKVKLKLNSIGPLTEVIIPDVGRNGEDGIKSQRVYKDATGRRWIYSNLDAHPVFTLYNNQRVSFACHP